MKRTKHHRKTNSTWTRATAAAKVDDRLHHLKIEQCYGPRLPAPDPLPPYNDGRPPPVPFAPPTSTAPPSAATPPAAPHPDQPQCHANAPPSATSAPHPGALASIPNPADTSQQPTHHKDFVFASPQLRVKIALPLYAGFRRRGGLSDFINSFNNHGKFSILVVPIDIVSNNDRYNILDRTNFKHYLALIADGDIIGILAGPLCETWSASRHRPLADTTKQGPRPFRSTILPFGMKKCTHKELTQVDAGNLLLTIAFRWFVEMISVGGFALIEHPADAGPEYASISKLPITQRLLSHPCVRKETFYQGLLGQISPKPTTILTLRMPAFHTLYTKLKTNVVPPPLPQHDESGAFATSAAKTYQPRFCALIAALILDTTHRQHLDVLRHALFMRQVVSKFKSMSDHFNSLNEDDHCDLIPHRIPAADIPASVLQLLEWHSEEQTHGPDYHGPLQSPS